MRRAAATLALIALGSGPSSAPAQPPELRGYYLNVGLWADTSALTPGGASDLQRLRLMLAERAGPLSVELAYEHVFTYRQRAGSEISSAVFGGIAPGGAAWVDLDWTLERSEHVVWRHRFDRLNLRVPVGADLALTVGRQAISWATTLFLTPADPFAPFDPSDPFREYRGGVDAARIQAFTGAFTEIEAVVRPTETPADETMTAVGRARGLLAGWEVSAWAGALHGEPAMGLGAAGAVGAVAVRGEASFREPDDDVVARFAVGVDSRLDLWGGDLYLVGEYQRDGLGAGDASELVRVALSQPFARGEMQVASRDALAGRASYQIHPLWTAELLALASLNDGSLLVAPATSYSVSNELTARAGLFLGVGGSEISLGEGIESEFGPLPTLLYASVSAFF